MPDFLSESLERIAFFAAPFVCQGDLHFSAWTIPLHLLLSLILLALVSLWHARPPKRNESYHPPLSASPTHESLVESEYQYRQQGVSYWES